MRLKTHLIAIAALALLIAPAAAAVAPGDAARAVTSLVAGVSTQPGLGVILGSDTVTPRAASGSAAVKVAQRVRRGERGRTRGRAGRAERRRGRGADRRRARRRADRRARNNALERRRSKSRRRKRIRNGIAIGVGAAVLGAIIANAAKDREARAYERERALAPLPPRDPAPRVYTEDRYYDDDNGIVDGDDFDVVGSAYEGPAYERNKRRCADRFNSFDWDTDTIIARTGDVVLCPYLR